ncbi:MAG: hypothetical protein R3C61_06985 [Bacteroidia bacterium]
MQNLYTRFSLTIFFLAVFSLVPPVDLRASDECPGGCMIRISGNIVEQSSRKPLRQANIIVRSGDKVLATQQTAKDGSFIVYIPPEKVKESKVDIKITYLNHIFVRHNLPAESQDLTVEINGALLLKEEYFDEHKVPFHNLENDQVGKIILNSDKMRLDPNAVTREVPSSIGT